MPCQNDVIKLYTIIRDPVTGAGCWLGQPTRKGLYNTISELFAVHLST